MDGGAALALMELKSATIPLYLKHTLPWHPTALMNFLGIGSGVVEGLFKWSSETLPSEMTCSGSLQCQLLPVPHEPSLQHTVVIHKHISALPCTALDLAPTNSQTCMTLPLDFLGELIWMHAGEHNRLGGMRINRRK